MYKLLIFSLLILFTQGIYAQGSLVKPTVIATAGTRYQTGSMVIDWTLGELSVSTLQNNSYLVSQGFHQPKFVITAVDKLPLFTGTMEVYPNPATDMIRIELTLERTTTVRAGLYDSNGKLVWNKEFHGQQITESASLKNLPRGNYFLKLIPDGFNTAQTFKIQKID